MKELLLKKAHVALFENHSGAKHLSLLCRDPIYFKRDPVLPGRDENVQASYKLNTPLLRKDFMLTTTCMVPPNSYQSSFP